LIKTPNPYEEDAFVECRIGSLMIRFIGHCIRCKAICNSQEKGDRNANCEPNPTLLTYRHNKKKGIMFGTYN
jgi:uncharacterized protein YcbX